MDTEGLVGGVSEALFSHHKPRMSVLGFPSDLCMFEKHRNESKEVMHGAYEPTRGGCCTGTLVSSSYNGRGRV